MRLAAADWPRDAPLDERMVVVDAARGAIEHASVRDLPARVGPGDLVVVNDAATLPASLPGLARGQAVELRLVDGDVADPASELWAVLFGAGDHRTRTEDRAPPPPLGVGDRVAVDGGLELVVAEVDPESPRLVRVEPDRRGAALLRAVYAAGRPVQYAHVPRALPLWHAQTAFAGRPWAFELPSAGRPLTLPLLEAMRARGARVVALTHAAGLSSTGDLGLDARLPLPERYDVPAETADAVRAAKTSGGRVIAIGTTAVRALEGSAAASGGLPRAGRGRTSWRGSPTTPLRVCDAILTGVHAPGESHFELLQAFAPRPLLERAIAEAAERGYLAHEFGDSMLLERRVVSSGADAWIRRPPSAR